MEFAILGGDRRQQLLACWLADRGQSVVTWGLEQIDDTYCGDLERALEAACVVLPLPVSRDGESLFAPFAKTSLALKELWPRLRREQLICGGNMGEEILKAAAGCGLDPVDYFRREELQVRNAAITAEGAVQRAMEETDTTLRGMACLVVGYGRIGRLLAYRLRGLGAEVSVAARREANLAWIEAMDCRPVPTASLAETAGAFQIIFNTVPARLLRAPVLGALRRGCLILELASPPGGVDLQAAERLGIRVISAGGLPGLTAPRAAAAAIGRTIYRILEERSA